MRASSLPSPQEYPAWLDAMCAAAGCARDYVVKKDVPVRGQTQPEPLAKA